MTGHLVVGGHIGVQTCGLGKHTAVLARAQQSEQGARWTRDALLVGM